MLKIYRQIMLMVVVNFYGCTFKNSMFTSTRNVKLIKGMFLKFLSPLFVFYFSYLYFWKTGFQIQYPLFSVFTSHVIKIKIVTIQSKNSRICYTIDDCNINNFAKNQASAIFHSRDIRRSVSPKFIELYMETSCLCPPEGHENGDRDVTKTSVVEFCY